MADESTLTGNELEMLRNNKQSGFNYRERRHDDWTENYTLGRDKVSVNRLTQRQSVNLPLMKTVLKTILKDMDDMPVLYFENLDNDKQAEIFKNEYWKYTGEQNRFEIQDIIDKKQEFYFGRTYDQWQVIDGKVRMMVQDPMDILVSRYTDPSNIHSSRFLIHTHIFQPLSVIEANPDYNQEAVKRLKVFYASEMGLIKAAQNAEMLQEKNQKMSDMGLQDVDSPILGETYVELSLHFVFHKEAKDEEEQIYLYVECDDMDILMKKPLEEVIGVTKDHYFRTHYPYCSWAGDVERQDWYSDGMADTVRTPNKVLNSWFSQLVENRTLRNFGMNFYNNRVEGFTPGTWNPVAWGWYGIPVPDGMKMDDVFKPVEIPDLSESLDEMTFVVQMLEKATGATPTAQGVENQRQITLGEVQLALGEAKERVKGMSKFYTQVWKDRGEMFTKICEAAGDKLDAVKIYKKGKNTDNIFQREISSFDWQTASGYQVKVWSQDEKNEKDTQSIEKINAVSQLMPGNPKLEEIKKRKLLEFAGLKPEETNEVMQYEQQKMQMQLSMVGNGVQTPGMPVEGQMPNRPAPPQIPKQLPAGGAV